MQSASGKIIKRRCVDVCNRYFIREPSFYERLREKFLSEDRPAYPL